MFLEIDWSNVSITLNDNEIDLPSSVIIPFRERYRARRFLRKHPLLFYVMLKQGKTWFSLVPEPRNLSVTNDNNGFFTCDLPEDALLLVVKVKTKTGNHTLVEGTEKQTEKFRPWKKPTKDGKTSPRKLPGILSPRKNDISVTSDSGPCPSSPTEMEYKPQFFDEPECLSSVKENVPPLESITPPSLKNLSFEEGMTENDTETTCWEASVAKKIMTTPRASLPYPEQPSTLEQLEPDMDNEIIDITDY